MEPQDTPPADEEEPQDEPPEDTDYTKETPEDGENEGEEEPQDDPENTDYTKETPEDGESVEDGDVPTGDDTQTDNPDTGDTPIDNGDGDGEGGDGNTDSPPEDGEGDGDTDYTAEKPEDGEGSGDGGDDGTTGDGTDDAGSDEASELQQLETELFSNMTPEQIKLKNIELKTQFVNLYDSIDKTINRVNKIPKTDENVKVLSFVTKKLMELQDLVKTNVTQTYNTKTYIENEVDFQHSLAIFNTIGKILDELGKKKQDK